MREPAIVINDGADDGLTLTMTSVTDPASNAACTTAIVDAYGGTVITLTAAGNDQTIGNPTNTTAGKRFTVVNNDTSTHNITIDGITLEPGESQRFIWDGTAWVYDAGASGLFGEVVKASSGTLTADECSGTVINNFGQIVANTQTLCPAGEGLHFRLVIATVGTALHIKAGAAFKIILDGTALDNADKVSNNNPTIYDYIDFYCVQIGAAAYQWVAESGRGPWVDGGP